MGYKTILFIVLLIGVILLAGCAKSSPTGYAAYNPQQGQQPYVGGGCGVAPLDNIGDASSISPITTNNL